MSDSCLFFVLFTKVRKDDGFRAVLNFDVLTTFGCLKLRLLIDCAKFTDSYGRILKANLKWSPTQAKFGQLIASLCVILPQLNLTKLKLENLKSSVQCIKEKYT